MKIRFLNAATCKSELKKLYKQLAKELHPDMGGSHAEMVQLNNEFEYLFTRLPETKQEQASQETAQDFMDVVQGIAAIPGIYVELCGTWLWVTGETRAAKDQLKAIGFRWASKKQAWFWHAGPYRKRGKRQLSLPEIRNIYGSERIEGPEREALTG